MKEIKTRKFLILRYDNNVSIVEHDSGKQELILFDGEKSAPFDNDVLEEFIRKTCIEKTQQLDLCLISENIEWALPELLTESMIHYGSVWNAYTIESAINLISPDSSLDILSENGVCIYRYIVLFGTREPIKLTAVFAGSEEYGKKKVPDKAAEVEPPEVKNDNGGLSDEEYKGATDLCRVFVDENREAVKRGRK